MCPRVAVAVGCGLWGAVGVVGGRWVGGGYRGRVVGWCPRVVCVAAYDIPTPVNTIRLYVPVTYPYHDTVPYRIPRVRAYGSQLTIARGPLCLCLRGVRGCGVCEQFGRHARSRKAYLWLKTWAWGVHRASGGAGGHWRCVPQRPRPRQPPFCNPPSRDVRDARRYLPRY